MDAENQVPKSDPTPDASNEANNETGPPNANITPRTAPTSQLPPPHPHCEIGCKQEKNWWDRIKPFAEIVGLIALVVYTGYTIKMYCATKEAADAAKKSADVAEATLVASNRPWIATQLALGGPLVFDKNGATMPVVLSIRNVGHSPAIRMRPDVEWFPLFLRIPNPPKKLMDVCNSMNSNSAIPVSPDAIAKGVNFFSQTLFPNDVIQEKVTLHMSQSQIEEGVTGIGNSLKFPGGFKNEKRGIQIDVIACIGYHASFVGTQYHTGIITELFRYEPALPYLPNIEAKPGTIPITELNLSIDPIFGTYTDPDTTPANKQEAGHGFQ